jgi:hypothetical protein
MDENGQFQPAPYLRAVDPDDMCTDDMYMDDMPMDLGACERLEREGRRDSLLASLIARVGDADALATLDAVPIPDEPFNWSVVEPADHAFVSEVVALSDRYCDATLDVEFRTITRRLIARVARRDPRPFRRSRDAARCAAAFVWLAGGASGEFGGRGPRAVHLLWKWFGVSSASDRGYALRRAAGLEPSWIDNGYWSDEMTLGDVSLLHSGFRARLLARRDLLFDIERGRRRWNPRPDGTAEIQARPAAVIAAGPGTARDTTTPLVLLGLGDHLDDADFFALTVPEAKSLVARVQHTLDGLKLSG